MTSLTPQRFLVVSVLALTVSILGMSAAARAQGQAGTTLTVTKTATGFHERRITYTWTLDKSVTPTMVELGRGATQQFTYEINTLRVPSLPTDTLGVSGEICVTNGGAVATEQLTIVDVVQSKSSGAGQFEDVIVQPVALGDFPQLAPGQAHCYPYEVTSPGPVPSGTSYRNEARVAITNHSGALDEIHVTVSRADFSLPTAPTTVVETDLTATVTDVEQCPAGFTCVPSNPGPFPFPNAAGSFTTSFTKAVTNVSAACNSTFALTNTVTLETDDTKTRITDNTLAGITTPVCPPLIVGCTHTLGFWLNHPTAWPVTTLTLGTVSYNQAQLLSILSEPPRGNGLVQLARQLIAAKLNVETGATTPAGVANDITSADLLIGTKVVPPVGTGSLPSGQTSGLVASLDAYNNGLAEGGAPHCGE
jgi:hypothetical protein